MLPTIARHAIAAYSHPGDLVLDPMCGIGTTLVEATHLGRQAIGIELEARWAQLASANIAHARRLGPRGRPPSSPGTPATSPPSSIPTWPGG
jgi:modification methylase